MKREEFLWQLKIKEWHRKGEDPRERIKKEQ